MEPSGQDLTGQNALNTPVSEEHMEDMQSDETPAR